MSYEDYPLKNLSIQITINLTFLLPSIWIAGLWICVCSISPCVLLGVSLENGLSGSSAVLFKYSCILLYLSLEDFLGSLRFWFFSNKTLLCNNSAVCSNRESSLVGETWWEWAYLFARILFSSLEELAKLSWFALQFLQSFDCCLIAVVCFVSFSALESTPAGVPAMRSLGVTLIPTST